MLAAAVTYVQSAPSIWDVVLPFIGAVCAIALVGVGFYPFYKKRKEQNDQRNARLDEACNAVLGQVADSNRGRDSFTPGLVHLLPLNGRRVVGVPTIMDSLAKASSDAATAAEAAQATRAQLAAHQAHDTERFDAFERRLSAR